MVFEWENINLPFTEAGQMLSTQIFTSYESKLANCRWKINGVKHTLH
jgi:hypothetical protein